VQGLATTAGAVRVPCSSADGVVLVEVDAGALTVRSIGGLDPTLGLVAVEGTAVEPRDVVPVPAEWPTAVAAAQRALAHELVGASAMMLDLARAHALDRIQFGVPIASFQAVRHRLAETYVAIEAARAALDAAWAEGGPFHAEVAKAVAGRAAKVAAVHCQQVLAGIGFTLEHPLHRYVRRVRVLDGLFGDHRSITQRLGAELLETRRLPAILPL
jgi:alkylation response protein AidB-like acyl-CoA dehydrogenase